MRAVFLIHANYLDKDFRLVQGDLKLEDGKIKAVGESLPYSQDDIAIDCEGYTIVPGFVDVHIHGCGGADTCDGTREAIDTMAHFLIKHGVTSFCPTTMTTDRDTIEKALLAAKECMDSPAEDGARVVGVNMEGPFISKERKGAQLEEAVLPPDMELFRHFYDLSGGMVKLIALAPEQPGGYEFAKQAKELCAVSIAHTTANYDEAKKSFDCGITHATHLFNAMSGFAHRNPGTVGAVFDDQRVLAELICDGLHIHPAVLRTAFRVLGDRALIVSDSMRANGLPEGEAFDLGGQMVTVKNGKATLADGTIAGSVTNLHQEIKNLVSFGIPLEQAVKAASLIPAKSIGMDSEIGSIELGKRADLVVLDEELNIVGVYH
ncbi:MAG: N-acetylglucosamine-6-phosphate deacetylase [Acutalibacter sp.]|nr:N-acetylglucosamine-6-phosphate deacetylase [Acutalibacter sp.]